jgi:hypothetical protein
VRGIDLSIMILKRLLRAASNVKMACGKRKKRLIPIAPMEDQL